MVDFFIIYTSVDEPWAVWLAWQLEEAGYTTLLQAWDFRPGSNFVQDMQQAAAQAARTIAVLSPEYLTSRFTQPEWQAAFAQDPTGERGLLLPVRVRACVPQGLLPQIVYIDLVGMPEAAAAERLLSGVAPGRTKPAVAPGFPPTGRAVPQPPRFPGVAAAVPEAGVRTARPLRRLLHPANTMVFWGSVVLVAALLVGMAMVMLPRTSQVSHGDNSHNISGVKGPVEINQ